MDDWYALADLHTERLNRRYLRAFNTLKISNFDELNVVNKVTSVYRRVVRYAKASYLEIAIGIYALALIEAYKKTGNSRQKNMTLEDAKKQAEKTISSKWVDSTLDAPNPVTKYKWAKEVARKRQRLIEALAAAADKLKEIETALRLWALQSQQYADTITDAAMRQAYKDAGVKRVKWVTQKDQKVCAECDDLDGQIYSIDNVPDKPHYHCRCYVIPA